jgi:glycosyltransferase involved in cell wall biosynthesis
MTAPAARAPLVAVVTPVYNGENFLAEAMESVQAQTYPNLIHVVHDNASTDATAEIIARYAGGRVPVLVARNERTIPMGPNWNTAIARVPQDAKYFRVLCADDTMEPSFIARMVDVAERNPSVIVVGCGLKHRSDEATNMCWDADREVYPGREAAQRFFEGRGIIVAHQTIFRRDALDLVKPFLDEEMAANDTDTCLYLLEHGDWGFVHDVLAMTRDHPGTDTQIVTKAYMHRCEYLALLERHAGFAFGAEDGRRWVEKYRRYYFRQLLRWRVRGASEIFERHLKAMRRLGARPLAWEFFDAVADWPLARLGLRPVWAGYPF